ncbi:MAG: hypothetical protein AB1640_00460 [bacterium]
MELAVHLRDPSELTALDGVAQHLTGLYGADGPEIARRLPRRTRRVYVGDEFCLNRLPSLRELNRFLEEAKAGKWKLTILTPPLTDEGLDTCAPLFERLERGDPATEVVVNDWGLLVYLKTRYPDFRLAAGRLLNKGFKDPRLPEPNKFSQLSREAEDLLKGCTFDSADFQEKMLQMQVERLERDLFPYGEPRVKGLESFGVSVYLPFGYVTSGRVCWLSSFHSSGKSKFSLGKPCDRLCSRLSLDLSRPEWKLRVFQSGNGIFYLYPASLLGSFLEWAQRRKLRLVYQGLAV